MPTAPQHQLIHLLPPVILPSCRSTQLIHHHCLNLLAITTLLPPAIYPPYPTAHPLNIASNNLQTLYPVESRLFHLPAVSTLPLSSVGREEGAQTLQGGSWSFPSCPSHSSADGMSTPSHTDPTFHANEYLLLTVSYMSSKIRYRYCSGGSQRAPLQGHIIHKAD